MFICLVHNFVKSSCFRESYRHQQSCSWYSSCQHNNTAKAAYVFIHHIPGDRPYSCQHLCAPLYYWCSHAQVFTRRITYLMVTYLTVISPLLYSVGIVLFFKCMRLFHLWISFQNRKVFAMEGALGLKGLNATALLVKKVKNYDSEKNF